MEPILQIKNLSKAFPGVRALDGMNFDLYPGEVHILAGENGAGKSTLCKCILGYLKPDQGQICFYGKEVSFSSPGQALALGIGAVYQEFTLIPWLSVAENIYFNREPTFLGTGIIRTGKMNQDAERILKELGSGEIDVTRPVRDLGIAGQQTVEIAKMLSANPRIMIFDEPTAALSDKETDSLFKKIRELKEKGMAIIYISHRLQEYSRIGDRVTVMRDGRYVDTAPVSEWQEDELIYRMIGREAGTIYAREQDVSWKEADQDREEVLRVEGLSDKKGKVRECSLHVKRGEIVGLAGLVGSGRSELAALLAGIDRPQRGKVILHGRDVTGKTPGQMIREGLGLLPEDRKGQGLALRASVKWNISSSSLSKLFPSGRIRHKEEEDIARKYIDILGIAVPGPERVSSTLSGGNQQKVVMAKWLLANTDFIIFDEPTRGIDVGAKGEIYHLMEEMVSQGKSILMISSELPEILGMSDRIYIMKDGRIVDEVSKGEKDQEALGRIMISDEKSGSPGPEEKKESKEQEKSRENKVIQGFKTGPWAGRIRKIPPGFYMLALLILVFGCLTDHYFTFQNFGTILRQAAPLLVIACGQTLIILTQGTDLSLGSIVSLSCVLWIYLLNLGFPLPGAIAITLLTSLLCGVANGLITAKAGIPVFITTLGTQNIFKSLALLLCGSLTIYYNDPVFRTVAKEGAGPLSWSTWIALLFFLATIFLLNKTSFGKKIKGLGGNPEAVTLSGASKDRTMIKAFACAGILAGIGGLLICCRIESGNPNCGNGLEFSAVAAVLLGGTSLREGRGGAGGTIFGVLLIQVLKNGLNQVGLSSIYQNAIIGTVVLCAIILDAVLKNYERNHAGASALGTGGK